MALRPFTLTEAVGPWAPLVVDSPHSGHIYPSDFEYDCPLPLLRQAEDAYVDEIVEGATKVGAVVIAAEFPRSMIDVNRAEDDIDPAGIVGEWHTLLAPDPMTLAGFGLVRRLCRNGISLYKSPLTASEVERRIKTYYRPYHECLSNQIRARVEALGACTLVDAHSMPDRIENGVSRPDFILGDRNGTTCNPALTTRAQKMLQGLGYRVSLNDPYKGREIVVRHGLLGEGAETGVGALQIEINRRLYMNEATIEKHRGFDQLREDMSEFFALFAQSLRADILNRLAAE